MATLLLGPLYTCWTPYLEIDKILDNFRAEYVSRSAEGNIDRLVEMYHPEAVIVHVGQFSKHGHAGEIDF